MVATELELLDEVVEAILALDEATEEVEVSETTTTLLLVVVDAGAEVELPEPGSVRVTPAAPQKLIAKSVDAGRDLVSFCEG